MNLLLGRSFMETVAAAEIHRERFFNLKSKSLSALIMPPQEIPRVLEGEVSINLVPSTLLGATARTQGPATLRVPLVGARLE